MPHGLDASVVARIQGVFAHYPQIDKAVLYGSRAKGNHRPASDIDITLLGNALSADILARIALELDELLLPYTIDLSLMAQLDNNALIDHIARVEVTFYVRSESATPSGTPAAVQSVSNR